MLARLEVCFPAVQQGYRVVRRRAGRAGFSEQVVGEEELLWVESVVWEVEGEELVLLQLDRRQARLEERDMLRLLLWRFSECVHSGLSPSHH